jgi:hypothetical protein
MSAVLPIILAFVVGALGWFSVEFIGKPFRTFFDMKRDGLESINQYDNVEIPLDPDDDLLAFGGSFKTMESSPVKKKRFGHLCVEDGHTEKSVSS